jgi:tripartite ATP-independent transporter DctM subunit
MDPIESGIVGVVVFLILMVLRVPIAFGMAIVGFVGYSYLASPAGAYRTVATSIFNTFGTYSLSVIPMFVWMGFIAYYSGIGTRVFACAYKLLGHFPGGLSLATQVTCGLFGAVCGSQVATAATIGAIAVPEMRKYGYDDSLSTASVAAGSTLGVIIPPSVLFIIYGIATEQSIGRLFIAGILPGILLMLLYMVTILILTYRNPALAPTGMRHSWKDRLNAILQGLWEVLIVFCVSLYGLFAGWFTPTEAGAVGAGGLLFLVLLRRQLSWEGFKNSLFASVNTVAMILFLVAGAVVFGRFLALSRIPFELATWAGGIPLPPFAIMAVVILIYLILGFFIDALALILLTIPIFYPLVVGVLGYDPTWFGVICVMVVALGVVTPPVGMNVYVIKGIAKDIPLEVIFRGTWPFVYAMILCIVLLIMFPAIVTFLPSLY